MRKRMSPGKDQRVFKHTADKTKKVNVYPKPYRGGIRM